MSDIDSTLSGLRDAAARKYGEVIPVSLDGVFSVIALVADSARSAVEARKARSDINAAMYFGAVEGVLGAMQLLGLPAPGRDAYDVIMHAEKVLAQDPATAEAEWQAGASEALRRANGS